MWSRRPVYLTIYMSPGVKLLVTGTCKAQENNARQIISVDITATVDIITKSLKDPAKAT